MDNNLSGGIMKKGCWEDSEVKDLFCQVENMKDLNKPLKSAFIAHAEKYRRKPNSVRNYYYYQLLQLKNDAIKTKRLGIDLSRHEKLEVEYFSNEDQNKLVSDIDRLVRNGMSVRKACFQLSGGNLNLMLRYQNKYRNYCLKQSKNNTQMPNNIITFKRKSFLSDNDINSLFLGLVRLVKKSAIDEFSAKAKIENKNANETLRRMLVDLNKKDREVEKLKSAISKLKAENLGLQQKMIRLECSKADNLTKQ